MFLKGCEPLTGKKKLVKESIIFKGVSTKHLQNYLNWFKFIELFKEERETKKVEKAFVLSQASYTECSIDAI